MALKMCIVVPALAHLTCLSFIESIFFCVFELTAVSGRAEFVLILFTILFCKYKCYMVAAASRSLCLLIALRSDSLLVLKIKVLYTMLCESSV